MVTGKPAVDALGLLQRGHGDRGAPMEADVFHELFDAVEDRGLVLVVDAEKTAVIVPALLSLGQSDV